MNGQQPGDPAKLARANIHLVESGNSPLRWVSGADAVLAAEQKAHNLLSQIEAQRALSASLGLMLASGNAIHSH